VLRIDENRLNIFAAVDNVLDKDFVESRGYSTRGRNFKIGLNFILNFKIRLVIIETKKRDNQR
jgi:hypothetical protein